MAIEKWASLDDKRVVVSFTGLKEYPTDDPFDPPERYPEYRLQGTDPSNQVYAWVRETLHRLGMDRGHFGTPEWNPLGEVIQPGMTVLLKPNTVSHMHEEHKDVFSVIIHGSVIRPILDYVCVALKNQGRIIIGDSQVIFGLFDEAMDVAKIHQLLAWYRQQTSIPIECMDFRTHRGVRTWMYGKWGRKKVHADPRGYQVVDLGQESCLKDVDPARLRIAIASYKDMYKHHSGGRHEYVFPKSVLESDAIISIPKLKTHRRTAVTLALKNFVGLPASKACLPHFQTGSVEEGGDQYIHRSWRKRLCTRMHDQIQSSPWVPVKFVFAILKKLLWNTNRIIPFKDNFYEAIWYGNDTLWRTLLDINRAFFYADRNGKLCDKPQRQHFCLMDGILAGEKSGPLSPSPVSPGVLMAGFNPVVLDAVAASLMGFDVDKIPLIKRGLEESERSRPLYSGTHDGIEVIDGEEKLSLAEFQRRRNLRFEPHPNWKGHIERG